MRKEDLWSLRSQICLNSKDIKDYKNDFNITPEACKTFFDGYVDYLTILSYDDGNLYYDITNIVGRYDTEDNLYTYYLSLRDYRLTNILNTKGVRF